MPYAPPGATGPGIQAAKMVVPESSINNIMGGLESTGGVTLHNHRRKLKQRFETIAKLGQGTYGKVQLGINKETGQEVAIKTIKKCKIETEADLIRIRREIQIMSSLRHPYIIHIYEVFENRDKMVLVMEYAAGGELYDYLSKKKVLDEQEARRIFRQIAMAVYYCHKHQICHRDLKLENILLDEQGNAKIADFGLSNVFDKSRLLSTFCGSPLYASPEIVKGIPYHGPEVDCWSLGVLLYTLVYGAMPFDGSNFKRLVRQISAGEYFEPKSPSTASEVIAGLLTVKGLDRLDITGLCKHPWMDEEGKVSCYRLAVELAEQEPNRLDLLLALAPQENQIPPVPEEGAALGGGAGSSERPTRSMSLSSLPMVQPSFTAPLHTPQPVASPQKGEVKEAPKTPDKEKKRERSTSRSRKKESDDEKPKKKSVKTKKKSDPDLSKEEMEKVLEEAKKVSEMIAQAPVAEAPPSAESLPPGPVPSESYKLDESMTSPSEKAPGPTQESKEKTKEVKKVKKVKPEKKEEEKKEPVLSPVRPTLKKEKEIDLPDKELEVNAETKPEEVESPPSVEPAAAETPVVAKETEPVSPSSPQEAQEPPLEVTLPFRRDSLRRKSKVFETAEIFNKSPTQEKLAQKKVFLPGVKVSDAKAAFERKDSVASPQETNRPDVCLASTINVNKLVQAELGKESPEEEKMKKENAVKVISHAISESGMNKASTLPRRKLSKPSIIPRAEPEHMVANTSVSQIVYPTPVPPPRPSLVKQESGGRKEHIIPIQIEKRDEKPPPVSKQTSLSSRNSSVSSIGRQDSDSSSATVGTGPSLSGSCEPIRKSPREVIIPIAVEGGGIITPSHSTLSKMSSMSEGEEEEGAGSRSGGGLASSGGGGGASGGGSASGLRGFGLHSTRRRVEPTDSLSSDEEDDNFEMLTAENLFSTLLSRVRNLTYRLNENETRPAFPRLFNHSIFDSPSRRLTETKSFSSSEQDPTPWRKKRETSNNASSSTLPRGFTARSFRRTLTGGGEEKRRSGDGRPPPAGPPRRRSEDEVVEDFLATGKLSSLDRVRSYLESIRRSSFEPAATSAASGLPPASAARSSRQSSLEPSASPSRSRYPTSEHTHRQTSLDSSYSARNKNTDQKKTSTPTYNGDYFSSPTRSNGYFEKYSYPRRDLNGVPSRFSYYMPSSSPDRDFSWDEKMNTILSNTRKINRATSMSNNDNLVKTKTNSNITDQVLSELQKKSVNCSNSENCTGESSKKLETNEVTNKDCNQSHDESSSSSQKNLTNQKEEKNKKDKNENKIKLDKNGSRVNKAINALKKKSESIENQFTESKLLKRAVSLEDLSCDEVPRSVRASSLKPEGLFEKKECPKSKRGGVFDTLSRKKEDREARISNLKRLELVNKTTGGGGGEGSAESTPTGDPDDQASVLSITDNSDTWSSCDAGDPAGFLDTEAVLDRIRRKSFYHRFNLPKRQAYNRSMSNMEKKRYH